MTTEQGNHAMETQTDGGAPADDIRSDTALQVWLLGHPGLQRRPDMVKVALRVFFRSDADALHARLITGAEVQAPTPRGDPAQLARMLRGQGFLVALRRDAVQGEEVVG